MQPQQGSRIDLVELRTQIVKRIGFERSKMYFFYLNRFLSQKLSKSEFDKSCFRLLGRENLPLHNQLIRSILKNACQAKTPPQVHEAGPAKSLIQTAKNSSSKEVGHDQSGSNVPNQNQNMPIWSNGVLPASPRKVRSGMRDRKFKDRPSPLGPNGKVDCMSYQSNVAEDSGNKLIMENGQLPPCDYQRPLQHLQTLAEHPEIEMDGSVRQSTEKLSHSRDHAAFTEHGEEVEQASRLSFTRSPLLAPLGIPFCSASAGGACKITSMASSSGDFVSYYDSGGLLDTEMLRKRMEHIAAAQGLGGVSQECANILNNTVNIYLKRLIKSCIELVGAQSTHDPRRHPVQKQHVQGKMVNGMWPGYYFPVQNSVGTAEIMQEQRPHSSISLLDLKVAMELNPHQLGEDWPLLLEKICMRAFED